MCMPLKQILQRSRASLGCDCELASDTTGIKGPIAVAAIGKPARRIGGQLDYSMIGYAISTSSNLKGIAIKIKDGRS